MKKKTAQELQFGSEYLNFHQRTVGNNIDRSHISTFGITDSFEKSVMFSHQYQRPKTLESEIT